MSGPDAPAEYYGGRRASASLLSAASADAATTRNWLVPVDADTQRVGQLVSSMEEAGDSSVLGGLGVSDFSAPTTSSLMGRTDGQRHELERQVTAPLPETVATASAANIRQRRMARTAAQASTANESEYLSGTADDFSHRNVFACADCPERARETYAGSRVPPPVVRKLPSILVDCWEFRKIASEGSVLPNALVSRDVDADGIEECIVGTTEGVLLVVKPDCRTPIYTHVLSATISVVLYSEGHRRLVLITLEGQCEVLDNFLVPRDGGVACAEEDSREHRLADATRRVQPTSVFHVPSNCFCGDLGLSETGEDRIFLGSFDRRMYVYSVTGTCLISIFMHSAITSIKALCWQPDTGAAASPPQDARAPASDAAGQRARGDSPAAGQASVGRGRRRGGRHRRASKGASGRASSVSPTAAAPSSSCAPLPLVFVATTRTLVLLRAGTAEMDHLRRLEGRRRHPLTLADDDAIRLYFAAAAHPQGHSRTITPHSTVNGSTIAPGTTATQSPAGSLVTPNTLGTLRTRNSSAYVVSTPPSWFDPTAAPSPTASPSVAAPGAGALFSPSAEAQAPTWPSTVTFNPTPADMTGAALPPPRGVRAGGQDTDPTSASIDGSSSTFSARAESSMPMTLVRPLWLMQVADTTLQIPPPRPTHAASTFPSATSSVTGTRSAMGGPRRARNRHSGAKSTTELANSEEERVSGSRRHHHRRRSDRRSHSDVLSPSSTQQSSAHSVTTTAAAAGENRSAERHRNHSGSGSTNSSSSSRSSSSDASRHNLRVDRASGSVSHSSSTTLHGSSSSSSASSSSSSSAATTSTSGRSHSRSHSSSSSGSTVSSSSQASAAPNSLTDGSRSQHSRNSSAVSKQTSPFADDAGKTTKGPSSGHARRHRSRWHSQHYSSSRSACESALTPLGHGGDVYRSTDAAHAAVLLATSVSRMQAQSVPKTMLRDGSMRPSLLHLSRRGEPQPLATSTVQDETAERRAAAREGGGDELGQNSRRDEEFGRALPAGALTQTRRRLTTARAASARPFYPLNLAALPADRPSITLPLPPPAPQPHSSRGTDVRSYAKRLHSHSVAAGNGASGSGSVLSARGRQDTGGSADEDGVQLPMSIDICVGRRRILLVASCEDGRAFVLEFAAVDLSGQAELRPSAVALHTQAGPSVGAQRSQEQAIRTSKTREDSAGATVSGSYRKAKKRYGRHRSSKRNLSLPRHEEEEQLHQQRLRLSEVRARREQLARRLQKQRRRQARGVFVLHVIGDFSNARADHRGSTEADGAIATDGEVKSSRARGSDGRRPSYYIRVPLNGPTSGTRAPQLRHAERGHDSAGDNGPNTAPSAATAGLERSQGEETPDSRQTACPPASESALQAALLFRVRCCWSGVVRSSPLVQRARIFRVSDDGYCAVLVTAGGTCLTVDVDTRAAVQYTVPADCSSFTLNAGPPTVLRAGPAVPPDARQESSAGAGRASTKAVSVHAAGALSMGSVEGYPGSSTAQGTVVRRALSCVCVCVDELSVYSIGEIFLSCAREEPSAVPPPAAGTPEAKRTRSAAKSSKSASGAAGSAGAEEAPAQPASVGVEGCPRTAMPVGIRQDTRELDEVERQMLVQLGTALMKLDGVQTRRQQRESARRQQLSGPSEADAVDAADGSEECVHGGQEELSREEDEFVLYAREVLDRGYSVEEWNALAFLDAAATAVDAS